MRILSGLGSMMSIEAKVRQGAARVLASKFGRRIAEFGHSTRANVAMIFGLALVPLAIAAGAGLDYSRGMLVHAQLITALDSSALAIGATPGLNQTQMQALAQQYFNANYRLDTSFGTPPAVTVTTTTQSVTVNASDAMPTTLMNVFGMSSMTVNASSTVVWGQEKLWVSLVLDNTGSMTQTDSTGTSKISALQTATHSLLTMLQNAATTAGTGSVEVSIVPFARDVKVGTGNANATWLDWTDFLGAPTPAPASSVGPGSACPYTDATNTFHCQANPTNGSSKVTNIPSSGTYKGYICPSLTTHGHYYNGCWTSTSSGVGSYTHNWVANAKGTWTGCVTDRAQNYDTDNTTPGTGSTLMVAENSPSCVTAALLGIGDDWNALNTEVDAMVANGSTNQTIGLVWGWQAQTQGVPLSAPALPANTQQVMILLSDGLNTQDRWYGDGSNQSTQVDDRMSAACTNLKAAHVTIYTIFVDLNGTQGNSTVLRNCASDASKYFDLTTSGQIISTFQAIGEEITNLRVFR
jgi:Flp pilus assembly protein TadG